MDRGREAELRRESRVALAMFVFLVVSFVGYCGTAYREPRWHATFFDGKTLAGRPLMTRWQEGLRFDWRHNPPFPGGPKDAFSARFETCLVLPERRKVAFLLTSDDGAWLFLDGALVIDNGGSHPRQTKGVEIDLEEGTHLLRVDYYEGRASAVVALDASLDGRAPRQIPANYLRRPIDGRCPGGRRR